MAENNSGPEEGIKGVVEDVKGKEAEAEKARAEAKTEEQRQKSHQ
jgi:hypothetical protein